MVTIIADNYYGYCKKEVKTQISFSANLYRPVRGGACRRRPGLRDLCTRSGVLCRPHRQPEESSLSPTPCNYSATWWSSIPKATQSTSAFRTFTTCPKTPPSTCAKGSSRGSAGDAVSQITLRAGAVYFLPSGFRIRLEKQPWGTGLAADRIAPARHPDSQTVHGIGRRQVGDLQIDRPCGAAGARLRQGIPSRHGPGGGNPEPRFLQHLPESRSRQPDAAADPQYGTFSRLRHPVAHALGRVHRGAQRLGAATLRRPSASLCSR